MEKNPLEGDFLGYATFVHRALASYPKKQIFGVNQQRSMIVTTIKKSVRKPAESFVSRSRGDYELVCNSVRLLDESGMDDEELSFLLGKRRTYFFVVIDPRKKHKLKTNLSAPLAAIFGEAYRDIQTLGAERGEMIQLHHAKRTVTEVGAGGEKPKKTVYAYSHVVYPPDGGNGKKIIWEKTVIPSVRHKVNEEVLNYLNGKVAAGYFKRPRVALSLYREMKEALPPGSFSIADLERGLARLLRSSGPLMRTPIDMQYHYHEWHEIFIVDPSDHPRLLEIWEASVRATHHFLREEDVQFFLPSVASDLLPTLEVYGIRNRAGVIMGFTGLSANAMEMLYIDPDYAKRGLGAFLTAKAVKLKGKPLYVEVNEQNRAAVAFYERIGFRRIGQSELDTTGRSFPVVHMELPNE